MADARLVVACCAFLSTCAVAGAQSVDGFNPGADGTVYALAVQPDGKILAGGSFERFIDRLNADGSRDTTFSPAVEGPVFVLAIQPDGKILVGGAGLRRVNVDGSIDSRFASANGIRVMALAVQADGKILIGGMFDAVGGARRQNIARLNADGSLDISFNPGVSATVYALAWQPDGKILVGGRHGLTRLNPGGSLDAGFNPEVALVEQTSAVHVIAVQTDGKILVGGRFAGLGRAQRENIGRLNADGTVDRGFNPGTIEVVETLAIQPDGKIVLGGEFTRLGGGGVGITTRNCIGRVHADGSLDVGFNPGANGPVHALALQSDGKVLVGGDFTGLGGGTGMTARRGIGRIVPSP